MISAEGLAVAVIVGIGCEHLAALGGTLESIALAKAGIIKEKRPVHSLFSWSTFELDYICQVLDISILSCW